MPGRARMYLPDYPYHIVQRGSNRSLFKHHLDDVGIKMIRKAAHYCHPIGDDRFKEEIREKVWNYTWSRSAWQTEANG